MSPEQLLHVSSFISCAESHECLRPFEPLRPRPSSGGESHPISRRRWHFAIAAVRGLLARARGHRTRWGPTLLARMQQRRRYHALYRRVVEASAAPLEEDEVKELLALEDTLEPSDIARFRTLALDDVEEKKNDPELACDAGQQVESPKEANRHWALGRLGRLAAAATSKVSSAARAAGRAAGNVVRSGASAAAKGAASVAGGFTSRGLGLSQEEMAALEGVLQAIQDEDEDEDVDVDDPEMNVALAVNANLSVDLSLCPSRAAGRRREAPFVFSTSIECFCHKRITGAWKCEMRALSLEGTTHTGASPHHHVTEQRVPILFCLKHQGHGSASNDALGDAQFLCRVEHFVGAPAKGEVASDERDFCVDMCCAPFNLSISPAIVECWWQWSRMRARTVSS